MSGTHAQFCCVCKNVLVIILYVQAYIKILEILFLFPCFHHELLMSSHQTPNQPFLTPFSLISRFVFSKDLFSKDLLVVSICQLINCCFSK